MPAKGKHRRPKTPRFSRSLAVAGTGGAALALPLLGATGAHAAPTAQSAPGAAVRTLPDTVKQTAARQDAGARTYTVRSGDCLATIAQDQHVSGGWQRLYDDNRQAVGADPGLIHPGLKLSIGGKAAPATAQPAPPESTEPAAPKAGEYAAPQATRQAAPKPAAQPASAGYTLPVAGATVGTGYHVAGSMWSSGYHTGVDFVVPTGTPLKAVAAGTVVSAGWGGAYGNQVVIKLNDGYYAQYGHLSQLSVSAGQTVTAGQQIGLSGATGNVTGPHLHFEIRTTPDYGSDVDPVAYLRSHGVAVG
ncbi:peptidase [Streptomyces regensis]|uniref:M23 family metallopeptidase n=1 Tax=unclassified Streptomyces TaxID=2593676 RepID=UPI0004C5AA93|nr:MULTISPECIES: LysM peptidoglycan-binding domain-containing M23 family metallopeptidase [unclassified Streptomyces]KMS77960.1 peptidase [Streptomyces regensis]MBG7697443.1 peptidoglycan DD-metalloendopeptidase family protein [Streptomyces sp. MC1]